jgi:hypothetical protein
MNDSLTETKIDAILNKTQRPSALRNLWERWKQVAKKIGDVQARVLLALFYCIVFGPFALALRWGADPLAIKDGAQRGWLPREEKEGTAVERARRQF